VIQNLIFCYGWCAVMKIQVCFRVFARLRPESMQMLQCRHIFLPKREMFIIAKEYKHFSMQVGESGDTCVP